MPCIRRGRVGARRKMFLMELFAMGFQFLHASKLSQSRCWTSVLVRTVAGSNALGNLKRTKRTWESQTHQTHLTSETHQGTMPIRLDPELGCWPTWRVSDNECDENINPASLTNDSTLLARLMDWDARFQSSYNMDDPSAFPSDTFIQRHNHEGEQLAVDIEHLLHMPCNFVAHPQRA